MLPHTRQNLVSFIRNYNFFHEDFQGHSHLAISPFDFILITLKMFSRLHQALKKIFSAKYHVFYTILILIF